MEKSKPLMLTIKKLDKEWFRYLRKISGELGMPEAYRRIIMFLSFNEGASQKEVAAFCEMTGAAVSQTIKEMQLLGYIRKENDKDDMRFFKLYLTEKAKASVEIIREKIHLADDFVTKAVTPQKEAEIVGILEELMLAIRKEV